MPSEFDDSRDESNEELRQQTELLRRLVQESRETRQEQSRFVRASQTAATVAGNVQSTSGSVLRTGVNLALGTGSALLAQQAIQNGQFRQFLMNSADRTLFGGAGAATRGGTLRGLGAAALGFARRHPLGLAAGAGALALGIGMRGGRSGGRGADDELAKQTQILQNLLLTARQQNVGINTLQATLAQRADPFGRGLQFQQARLAGVGNLVTGPQVGAIGAVADARNQFLAAQEANQRTRAQLRAPGQLFNLRVATAQQRFARNFRQGAFGLSTRTVDGQRQGGALDLLQREAGRQLVGLQTLGLSQAFGPLLEQFPDVTDPLTRGALGGPLQRQLFELQLRGPGRPVPPVPTARAGTAEDYRLRVRLERQGQAAEDTRLWQDQVLDLLRQLNSRGNVTDDELYQTERRFNRLATVGID